MLTTRLAALKNSCSFRKSFEVLRRCYSRKAINLSEPSVQRYLDYLVMENEHLLLKEEKNSNEIRRLHQIKSVVSVLTQRNFLQKSIADLKNNKKNEEDEEVKDMMQEEYEIYRKRAKEIEIQLQSILLEPVLSHSGILLEIVAAEGDDATLFAKELFDLYKKYGKFKNWVVHDATVERSDKGYKRASILIEGLGALELMNFEKGVHHRISDKDQVNRISTVLVSVFLQPSKAEMDVADTELTVETQTAQSDDDTSSQNYVCVTHTPTGTTVECSAKKSNKLNKHIAMKEMNTLLFHKQKQSVEEKENTGPIQSDRIIRTYDHITGRVMEHREKDSQLGLKDFMQGDEVLDNLHETMLNRQHYQDLMNDIKKFDKKEKEEDDDEVYTPGMM